MLRWREQNEISLNVRGSSKLSCDIALILSWPE
jgi:hypothetical protein